MSESARAGAPEGVGDGEGVASDAEAAADEAAGAAAQGAEDTANEGERGKLEQWEHGESDSVEDHEPFIDGDVGILSDVEDAWESSECVRAGEDQEHEVMPRTGNP